MIEKKIKSIYPIPFIFVIAKNRKRVSKKYGIKWNGIGGTCYFRDVIWIIVNSEENVHYLVHECDHAVSELWNVLEIKKINGVDECYSYMLEWLFKKCYKIWKKNARKNK